LVVCILSTGVVSIETDKDLAIPYQLRFCSNGIREIIR